MLPRRSGAPELVIRPIQTSWLSADRRARPMPASPRTLAAESLYHQTTSPSVSRMNAIQVVSLPPVGFQNEVTKNPWSTLLGDFTSKLVSNAVPNGAPVV